MILKSGIIVNNSTCQFKMGTGLDVNHEIVNVFSVSVFDSMRDVSQQ